MNLGRNILWNMGGFLWLTLLVILVTPYMVRGLGLDAYGIWAVLAASTGYLAALDFGLGNALIRFLAAEVERGDRESLEGYLRTGITLQTLLGLLAGSILLAAAPSLAGHWFRVPANLVGEAVDAFRLGAVAVLLGFLVVVYAAVPAALHRFDLLAIRTVILFTLQYSLIVAVLHFGGGLRGVVVASVIGTLVVFGYMVAVARSLLPGVVLLPGWNRRAVEDLYRFARFKFVAQTSVNFLREFDRVAIAIILPVGQVPFYAVPLRLSQRITQIAEQIASPFYPTMTAQLTGGRGEELRTQYRVGTRMVAIVAFGITAVLGGLAAPVLQVWLGPEFARESTWVLRMLLLAYSAAALFTLPSVAADGAGLPGVPAAFLAAGAILHVPVVLVGVHLWGPVGAALGVLAGFLVALTGVVLMHIRVPELPPLVGVLKEIRGAFLASILTAAAGLAAAGTGYPGSGIFPVILTLLLAGVLYLGFLVLFRGLHRRDVTRLAALLQRA